MRISETGGDPAINTQYGDTWTGSNGDGTIHSTEHLGAALVMCGLWPHTSGAHWFYRWSGAATEVKPVYGLSMPLTLLDPSLLRISNIDPLGEDLLLTFYGKEGTTYYVESSGDLSTWTTVVSDIVGTGIELSITLTGHGASFYTRRYFRVTE